MLRVAIRTDASSRTGIGHVMRCLTLARLLVREVKADIHFICNRDVPTAMKRDITAAGFRLSTVDEAAAFDWQDDAVRFTAHVAGGRMDWVVVDHYGIDHRWERTVRDAIGCKLLIIDDLANRQHHCDALLDQNLIRGTDGRYRDLVPADCRLFLGPGHALLRETFFAAKDRVAEKSDLRQVLVNFGGSDPTGETFKVLEALAAPELARLTAHVVAGPANPRLDELRERCLIIPNVTFYPAVADMASLLAEMDLAIGAGGVSLWERSFMGVPSVVIAVADNQVPSAMEAARRDMIWYLGESVAVAPETIGRLLRNLVEHPAELGRKSKQSLHEMHTLRNVAKHPVVSFMLEAAGTERSLS